MIYCEYGNEQDGCEGMAFELTDQLSIYQQVKRESAKRISLTDRAYWTLGTNTYCDYYFCK